MEDFICRTEFDFIGADSYTVRDRKNNSPVLPRCGAPGTAKERITMAEKKYVLTNRRSGKAMAAAGTAVVQMTADGSDAQVWCAVAKDGAVQLLNKASGLALTVPGVAANGAALILAEASDSPAQAWKLSAASKGFKKLLHVESGLCVDIAGISDMDGAAAQLWAFLKGENQEWTAEEAEASEAPKAKRVVKEVKAAPKAAAKTAAKTVKTAKAEPKAAPKKAAAKK